MQAQLTELELKEMKGVFAQAEEEPEGEPEEEMLVGIRVGRSSDLQVMDTAINFLSLSWCTWEVALLVVICFTLGALWPPR